MSYFPGSPPGRSALDRVTPVRADFWRDCDVFVTGHTGFKGAWLRRIADPARGPGARLRAGDPGPLPLPPGRRARPAGVRRPWRHPGRGRAGDRAAVVGGRRRAAPGGPVDRPRLLRRPARDLLQQRRRHGRRARCRPLGGGRDAVRGGHHRQGVPQQRVVVGLPRGRPARRRRPVQRQQGVHRAGGPLDGGLVPTERATRWPRPAPATSSAAATRPRTP